MNKAYINITLPLYGRIKFERILLATTVMLGAPAAQAHSPVPSPIHAGPGNAHQNWTHSLTPAHMGAVSHNPSQPGFGTSQNGVHFVPPAMQIAAPLTNGLALDLTSAKTVVVLGEALFGRKDSLTINVGGSRETFVAGQKVTAAEFIALQQVAGGAHQTLRLDVSGTASGGLFNLNAAAGNLPSQIVIPHAVTALDNAKPGQTLELGGDIINYGRIIDPLSGRGNVIISGQNFVNETGGLISAKSGLSLQASENIQNQGTIFAGGALTLTTAHGSVVNFGTSAMPVLSAGGNVNIASGSGNIQNNGLIESRQGNIILNNTAGGGDINVYGAGGTLSAVNGSITVREHGYAGAGNVNLAGGNYLANQINIYSGKGEINGTMDQVTGALNTCAAADHVAATTPLLTLGSNTITGDPTFANSGGDIRIAGVNTFGENVAILASGNIMADNDAQIIANGFNVTMIAGGTVQITGQGGASTPKSILENGTSNSQVFTPQVRVSFDSKTSTGGSIDLRAPGAVTVIDTSSNINGVSAGNISLIAYSPNGIKGGGQVLLSTGSTIDASAAGTGSQAGNVSIVAAASNAADPNLVGVQIGSVKAGNQSSAASGSISVSGGVPVVTGKTFYSFDNTGTVISKNSVVVSGTTTAKIIIGGDLTTAPTGLQNPSGGENGSNGGDITVSGGGDISLRNVYAFGQGGAGGGAATINGGTGGNGGNVSITSSAGSVSVTGQINVSGGGGGGGADNGSQGIGGGGGTSGNILITAGRAVTISGIVYAVDGGAGGTAVSGAGGGGGGSYGGGGGGGSSTSTQGGNGGGGFAGGGGGDILVGAGGGGGGITGGGATGAATAGAMGLGGIGQNNIGAAATFGQGGLAPGGIAGSDITPATSGGVFAVQNISLGDTQPLNLGQIFAGTASLLTLGPLTINQPITASASIDIGAASLAEKIGLTLTTAKLTAKTTGDIGADNTFIMTNANQLVISSGGNANIIDVNSKISVQAVNAQFLQLAAFGLNPVVTITGDTTPGTGNVVFGGAAISVANGILDLGNNNSLTASGTGQNGGFLQVAAKSINWTSSATTDVVFNASASSKTAGNGGTVAIFTKQLNLAAPTIGTSAGQMSLQATGGGPGSTGGDGGSITVTVPNTLTVADSKAINVATLGQNGNGGTIILDANTIVSGVAGNLAIKATGGGVGGTGVGNGGHVTLIHETNTDINIGNGAGQISINVANGQGASKQAVNAGFVELSTSGNINLDTTGSKTGAPNGITLAATGPIDINGGSLLLTGTLVNSAAGPILLAVNGAGNGNGGALSIVMNNITGTYTIGTSSSAQLNLQAQSGSAGGAGGVIQIVANADINFETAAVGATANMPTGMLVNPLGANGNGGTINLDVATVNSVDAGSAVLKGTPLKLDTSGVGTGDGGFLSLATRNLSTMHIGTAKNTNPVINPGDTAVQLISNNGAGGSNGGSVTVDHNAGAVSIDDVAALSVLFNPGGKTAANINGGRITILAKSLGYLNSPTPALTLNASGLGTGSGGSITLGLDGNVAIGTGAGQYQLLATSGKNGGNGGFISITAKNSLTVNAKALSVSPLAANGAGGSIALAAASGTPVSDVLQVNGTLNSAGKGKGAGGQITLSSASQLPFSVGLPSSTKGIFNGIAGGITVKGKPDGNVGIASVGNLVILGSIATGTNIGLVSSAGDVDILKSIGATGTALISVTSNAGNIYGLSPAALTGNSVLLNAKGNIGGATLAKGVLTPGPALGLALKTSAIQAQAVNGYVNLKNTSTSKTGTTVKDSAAGTNFTLLSSNNIITAEGISATAIQSGQNLTLVGPSMGSITSGGASFLQAQTVTLNAGSTNITVNASDLNVTTKKSSSVLSSGAGALTLDSLSASGGLTLSAAGDLIIGKSAGASVGTSASTISLMAANINGPSTLLAKSIVLATAGEGLVGTALSPLLVNAPSLAFQTAGAVFVNDSSTKSTILSSSNVGSIILNTGAALTVGSITASSGNIQITSNLPVSAGQVVTNPPSGAKYATGTLQSAKNALISAPNGAIFLQNSNINAGKIVISTGTTIETGRPFGGGGAVVITIGQPAIGVTGPALQNASVTQILPGQVFFGKNGISASISKGQGNNIVADMADVFFSTGNLKATAIQLAGGTTIIADPPAPAGAPSFALPSLQPPEISAPYAGPNQAAPQLVPASTAVNRQNILPASNQSLDSAAVVAAKLSTPFHMPLSIGGAPDWPGGDSCLTGATLVRSGGKLSSGSQSAVLDLEDTSPEIQSAAANGAVNRVTGKAEVTSAHHYKMSFGSAVFAPERDTVIENKLASVVLKAGTVALVVASADRLAIYNLHDRAQASLIVRCASQKFLLNPGQHLTITDKLSEFDQSNAIGRLLYTAPRTQALTNGLHAHRANFFLPQAIYSLDCLGKLINSPDKEAKKLSADIIKTASIMATITHLENYRQYCPAPADARALAFSGQR